MSTDRSHLILIVDDDFLVAEMTREVLSSSYQVHHVGDGQAALHFVAEQIPDLLLLDIAMPGMDGYEVCKQLRSDSRYDDMAIVFLSGLVDEQQRIAGYEVGGDDFLAKPASAKELCYKIDLTLKHYAERRRLKSELSNSFMTAMTAMTTVAEIGSILHFLRSSFNCQDYQSLCHEVINTLDSYGLIGSVQIRGEQGTVSFGSNGICSPLEESALNLMFGHGRLFEFSSCLSCSYEHITVIVKNIERDDPEKRGRIRDNIALLTEGADVRIVALDRDYELMHKHEALQQLIANTSQALREIEQQQHRQLIESDKIFQDLLQTFNIRMMTMGLSDAQEEELTDMIQTAADRALALYDRGLSTEVYMEKILRQLDGQAK
ncbi:MAG: hypothetical protein Kow0065_24150 [Methylomicrobium sp.]